ncbi:MAG: hypothetical protein WBV25_09360 [Methylocella sp.]
MKKLLGFSIETYSGSLKAIDSFSMMWSGPIVVDPKSRGSHDFVRALIRMIVADGKECPDRRGKPTNHSQL